MVMLLFVNIAASPLIKLLAQDNAVVSNLC